MNVSRARWSTKHRTALASAVLLVAAASCSSSCAKPPTATESVDATAGAHSWKVFDGDELVLDVTDTPGPILSTAALPPGVAAARHPFLSASARSARHEHKLREHLEAAKSLPDFLRSLRAAGYRVVPVQTVALAVPSTRPQAPTGSVAAPSASVTDGSAAADDALAFRMVENIEMVPYCLPYPSAYMKEDFSERWEHGRKVFRARVTPASGKAALLDLAGTCGSRTLKELYEADRKNIETEGRPPATVTLGNLQRDSYALSWRVGDRIHYGKMWVAKGDPGCFVRATFEYDERERATFDTIIARVAAADPACSSGPSAVP